ncbi:hypothetical protein QJS04_geneDACA001943 [Acorus gramineus]|uniref:Protein SHORTAGE IN CHIASMATA 1 n=1 Tax=Acorus gramineus TaxID=55184 RepID=A0AAV9A941_ACOGR|nr:hypothetical protein QJS04_geneDACA001943 [Acorus gramineus]
MVHAYVEASEIDGRISFSGIDVAVSVDWESLSLGFDGALSLLLSDVLPEICVSEEGKISAAQSASGRTRDLRSGDGEFQELEVNPRRSLSFDEEEYGRFRTISGSGNPDIDNGEEELFEFLVGDDESEKYHLCISETLEFEIPEREFEYFGENSKNPQSENSLHIGLGGDNGLLSLEVPKTDSTLEEKDFAYLAKTVFYLDDFKWDDTGLMSEGFEKLLSSIEDMPTRIHVDHNSPLSAENNSSVTDRTLAHPRTFPCFEDSEISWELDSCQSENEFHILLSNLKLCCQAEKEYLLDDCGDHQVTDILECVISDSLPEQLLGFQPMCLHSVLEMNVINEAHTLEIPEQLIEEGVDSSGCFYESLISSELALVDDTFRSLPVPVCCDDNIMDEACNRDVCCMCSRKLLEEINIDRTAYLPQPSIPDMGVIDFVNLDETLEGSCTFQSKEIPSELPFVGTEFIETATKPTTSHEPREEISHPECRDRNPILSFGRVSSILDSESQYNDLNYYINARRGGTKRSESGIKDNAMGKVEPSVVSSEDSTMPCASLEVDSQKQQIEVHQVMLCGQFLELIEEIQKSCISMFQNDIVLEKDCSFPAGDVLKLMNLPKQELVNLITGKTKQSSVSASEGDTFLAFLSLCAIKKMAYYLCFYGIHAAYLYLRNLFHRIIYLRVKLSLFQSLIEDAHWKVEKKIIESHPSLTIIEGILRPNSSLNNKKVLIVADQVFWLMLTEKLTEMGISYHEITHVHNLHSHQSDLVESDQLIHSIMDALHHADCLLIPHEHVFSSLPFNKFNIIVEYGGPNGVPTISPNFSKLVSLPHVHFLKVELEGSSTLKSLSEDFDVSKLLEILMEGVPRSISVVQEGFSVQQFAEVINYVPVAANNSCIPSGESEYGADPCHNTESSSFPYLMTSKDMDPSMSSLSDTVIIVNTQNYDKEMLISRRSSYQRILALEKGGVQVVEREVNLPVDLIFSAAVCLVWYDAKNVGLSSTTSEEVSSGLPIFVEKITEVLTSMSFAFSDCILVFEGEINFIGTVMESLNGLYAAANILDIHLQIFWSCSPELTDEIILSCIRYAAKSNGGLFPTLPESETLAETFLTKFPSINPLSANAILSSGGMLVEFLKWSNDRRIKAVGRFHVPDESIALFNALCTYGELGESKSGMTETECSSVDSDNNSFKMLPQRKKQKCMVNNTVEMPTDNFLYQQPIFQPSDSFLEPSEALQSYNHRFSNVHEPPQKAENSRFNTNETFSSRKWGINHSVPNNLPPFGTTKSVIGHDDTRGVVVDYDDSFLDEKLPPVVNSSSFWTEPELEMEVAAEASWPAEKFAGSMKNHRVFPTIGEINHDLDGWRQSPKRYKASGLSNLDIYRDASRQVIRNSPSLSVHGKGEMSTSRNRFQDPVLSSQLQPGSRRKVQNFGRAKQNRENMISPPLRTSMRGSSSSKGTDTSYKKMSPSIIYSYRYEGDSQPKKTNKQNWQKGVGRPPDLSSIHKNNSSSLLPTWTPIDKRARQNLTFMRNGNAKQSKLVWRNMNVPGIRKRHSDEA